jgi:organic radical activating enzyme
LQTNIETSGAYPLSGSWDWICVSPKKFKAPLPAVLQKANELKVVIYHPSDFEWAEQHAAAVGKYCKLYLQPEWSKKDEMLPVIVAYIKQNPKWELSIQLHKYIHVP